MLVVRFGAISATGLIAYSLFGLTASFIWCTLAASLATLGEIDIQTQLIPNWLVLVVALLAAAPLVISQAAVDIWIDRFVGALLAGTVLWAVAEGFQRARGTPGLGLGDVKLAAAGGLWVGWALVPQVLLMASLAGIVGAFIATRGLELRTHRLAFGPYLSLAIGFFSIKAHLDIV